MQDIKSFPISYFLIEAALKWIEENKTVAQIIMNPEFPDVIIPKSVIAEGEGESNQLMFFEISPDTVLNFKFDRESVSFEMYFNNKKEYFFFPIYSIHAVKCSETNLGVKLPPFDIQEYERNKEFYCPSLVSETFNIKEKMYAISGNNGQSRTLNPNNNRSHLRLVK